ncbi:hypothetical protein EHE19_009890 [Ruminiclostridium herbifermentans]|uniref:cellulase n=1 Tax=Ruminiclostridium herbifermentans TaxID=2488810 RepID=A0A4U7JIR4_9FIRM|nr:dockerin type I domain-containing protein [Ruminiclostridium herbifermentans]QNU65256.1 hypothetical protein EHE19_009890 [Ruminiclostridium herbifermentans]
MNYTVIEPPEDTEAPTAPTDFTCSYLTNSTISLSWTEAKDNVCVAGYNIYDGSKLISASKTTQCIITGLSEYTSHRLTVKSKDVFGNLSAASNEIILTPKVAFKLGDIIMDGEINSIDLSALKAYLIGIITELDSKEAADTNRDGFIDALDYAALIMYLLGSIDFLPSK